MTSRPPAHRVIGSAAMLLVPFVLACGFDQSTRWWTPPADDSDTDSQTCDVDEWRCLGTELQRCRSTRETSRYSKEEDCAADNKICSQALHACASCDPGARRCDGQIPEVCNAQGSAWEALSPCSEDSGLACRNGSCIELCAAARTRRSNVGCEYWAVDLDNAFISPALNAAEQQFAVVVSNPQNDLRAKVTVERDDSMPGEKNTPIVLLESSVAPLGLKVFPLGPREVDGSAPGTYNSGSHTALTRHAYRIRSNVPVVAFQFNPLSNVGVFSNDASLLKPVEALGERTAELFNGYVVLGWPQTIADTDDPRTNFRAGEESSLRVFLTIVGTRLGTRVRVTPSAKILGAPGVDETGVGESLELELSPFDVLNLETDDFNADFTGSLIAANAPVVVFSGSEASDAPVFDDLSERKCCADHLEEQLDHVRTAGRHFVAPVAFNRSLALALAGAGIGVVPSDEVFRVIATAPGGAKVTTTLRGRNASFRLNDQGDFREILTSQDFILDSDQPVMLGNVSPSQQAAGIPSGLPGGDPSFLIIPPVEQFRRTYVFLTPDSYSFDFLRVIAPPEANIVLDGRRIGDVDGCTTGNLGNLKQTLASEDQKEFTVYRCQLGFPKIDPAQGAAELLRPGLQNDGVHILESDHKVGVLVDGFDRNVSYAYAAGTELEQIVPR